MSGILYRGSVKDVRGPLTMPVARAGGEARQGVAFDYTDAYSVFDWGRMPDLLPRKGESLAMLTAELFERLEKPEIWKELSKAPEALALRKGNRFGSAFNELGEKLQAHGLRTHYLGIVDGDRAQAVAEVKAPQRSIFVQQVSVVKPEMATLQGRQVPDYSATLKAPLPRLVPLEVVFRFSCPPGSSLASRVERDSGYLAGLGFAGYSLTGATWDLPLLEPFTKLETTDRPLTLSESLAISGLTGTELQELFFKTAWTAAALRWFCRQGGIELADGKFEWAVSETREIILVDAIGPDELRLLKDGVQLSKEFLRAYYRRTPWYAEISRAKDAATAAGSAEWKKRVAEGPPPLPAAERELAAQLYLSLSNALSGRRWFSDGWDPARVAEALRARAGGTA